MKELPAEIGHLTQLTALDVSNNHLESLPEGKKEEDKGVIFSVRMCSCEWCVKFYKYT